MKKNKKYFFILVILISCNNLPTQKDIVIDDLPLGFKYYKWFDGNTGYVLGRTFDNALISNATTLECNDTILKVDTICSLWKNDTSLVVFVRYNGNRRLEFPLLLAPAHQDGYVFKVNCSPELDLNNYIEVDI